MHFGITLHYRSLKKHLKMHKNIFLKQYAQKSMTPSPIFDIFEVSLMLPLRNNDLLLQSCHHMHMSPYTCYRPIASWDSLFVSVSLVFISGRSPFCSQYS